AQSDYELRITRYFLSTCLHRILERSDAVDPDFHFVACLEEDRRHAREADARGRAGKHQVAYLQCINVREIGHDLRHSENELAGVGILQRFSVDATAYRQRV